MRRERVAVEIKRQISQILQDELRDPRIGFVTIIDVDLSPDLKNARVYFSVLADRQKEEETLKALDHAAPFVRRLIGQRIKLRFNPEISLKIDSSIRKAIEIEEKIREINEEKNT